MNCSRCGITFDPSSSPCPGCNWNPNARQKPLAGYLVGERVNDRFAVIETVGMGRLGVVIKAKDLKTNKLVALKVLHPSLIPDEDAGNRFLACMRAQKSTDRSGIAKIVDVGKDSKNFFFARELLFGVTFKQLLDDQRICGQPFPIEEAVEIVQQIAKILTSAKGEAHGSFSPHKIWILDQRIQIVDFGMASYLPRDAVWHCLRRKENRYLAPEYIDNRPPDPAGDVYALGVMLGEMLSLSEFDGRVEGFRESEPDFPVEIEALLRCALSRDVDARYSDAMELAAALHDVTGIARTRTMPPENTNVVPSKFLNTLRTMSEAPAPFEAPRRDTEPSVSSDDPPFLDSDDIIEEEDFIEDNGAAEENDVITRQVLMREIMQDAADEDDLEFLDEEQPVLLGRDVELDSEPPKPSVPAISPPPFNPADGERRPAHPSMPRPGSIPPRPGSIPPRPGSIPPRPGSIPPRPSGRPSVPTGASVPKAAAQRPSVPPGARRRPSLPVPRPSKAPPSERSKGKKADIDESLYEKFEGINPRFLRAAAKLQEAHIGEVDPVPKESASSDDEEWRKQLENSSAGSVISFLPPTTQESINGVKGFPRSQKDAHGQELPPKPSVRKLPPPPPTPKKKG